MTPGARRLVVLVRHGESEWNAVGRFQGQKGTGLTPYGYRQAAATAAHVLAQFGAVDRIVRSDLQRAAETAAPLEARVVAPVDVDPRWREIGVGSWAGRTVEEIAAVDPEGLAAWRALRDEALGDRESFAAFRRRVAEALGDAAAGHGVTVVVTHGGAIRMAVAAALGLPRGGEGAVRAPDNASVTLLTARDGGLRLRCYNEAGHLVEVGSRAPLPG